MTLSRATRIDARRGTAVAIAALLALAALLVAALPSSAEAKRLRGNLLVAHLQPLSGADERGTLHMTVREGQLSIIAILIGLKADPQTADARSAGGSDTFTYKLRLSRRTCGQFEEGVRRPRFIGPALNEIVGDFDGDGTDSVGILDGTSNTFRGLRRARSVVLYVEQDNIATRACGKVHGLKLENVRVSS
jgi:hypothetical protein